MWIISIVDFKSAFWTDLQKFEHITIFYRHILRVQFLKCSKNEHINILKHVHGLTVSYNNKRHKHINLILCLLINIQYSIVEIMYLMHIVKV